MVKSSLPEQIMLSFWQKQIELTLSVWPFKTAMHCCCFKLQTLIVVSSLAENKISSFGLKLMSLIGPEWPKN